MPFVSGIPTSVVSVRALKVMLPTSFQRASLALKVNGVSTSCRGASALYVSTRECASTGDGKGPSQNKEDNLKSAQNNLQQNTSKTQTGKSGSTKSAQSNPQQKASKTQTAKSGSTKSAQNNPQQSASKTQTAKSGSAKSTQNNPQQKASKTQTAKSGSKKSAQNNPQQKASKTQTAKSGTGNPKSTRNNPQPSSSQTQTAKFNFALDPEQTSPSKNNQKPGTRAYRSAPTNPSNKDLAVGSFQSQQQIQSNNHEFVTRADQPQTYASYDKNPAFVDRVCELERLGLSHMKDPEAEGESLQPEEKSPFNRDLELASRDNQLGQKTQPGKGGEFVTRTLEPGQNIPTNNSDFLTRSNQPEQTSSINPTFVTGSFQPDQNSPSKRESKFGTTALRQKNPFKKDPKSVTRAYHSDQKPPPDDQLVTGYFQPDQNTPSTKDTKFVAREYTPRQSTPRSTGAEFVTGCFIPDQEIQSNNDPKLVARTVNPEQNSPSKNNPQAASKTFKPDEKTRPKKDPKVPSRSYHSGHRIPPDKDGGFVTESSGSQKYSQSNSDPGTFARAAQPEGNTLFGKNRAFLAKVCELERLGLASEDPEYVKKAYQLKENTSFIQNQDRSVSGAIQPDQKSSFNQKLKLGARGDKLEQTQARTGAEFISGTFEPGQNASFNEDAQFATTTQRAKSSSNNLSRAQQTVTRPYAAGQRIPNETEYVTGSFFPEQQCPLENSSEPVTKAYTAQQGILNEFEYVTGSFFPGQQSPWENDSERVTKAYTAPQKSQSKIDPKSVTRGYLSDQKAPSNREQSFVTGSFEPGENTSASDSSESATRKFEPSQAGQQTLSSKLPESVTRIFQIGKKTSPNCSEFVRSDNSEFVTGSFFPEQQNPSKNVSESVTKTNTAQQKSPSKKDPKSATRGYHSDQKSQSKREQSFVTGSFQPDENTPASGCSESATRKFEPSQAGQQTLSSKLPEIVTRIFQTGKKTSPNSSEFVTRIIEPDQQTYPGFTARAQQPESRSYTPEQRIPDNSEFVVGSFFPEQQNPSKNVSESVTKAYTAQQKSPSKKEPQTATRGYHSDQKAQSNREQSFVTGSFQPDDNIPAPDSSAFVARTQKPDEKATPAEFVTAAFQPDAKVSTKTEIFTRTIQPYQEGSLKVSASKTGQPGLWARILKAFQIGKTQPSKADSGTSVKTSKSQPKIVESDKYRLVTKVYDPAAQFMSDSELVTGAYQPEQEKTVSDKSSFVTRIEEPSQINTNKGQTIKTDSDKSNLVTRIQEPAQGKTSKGQTDKSSSKKSSLVTRKQEPSQAKTSKDQTVKTSSDKSNLVTTTQEQSKAKTPKGQIMSRKPDPSQGQTVSKTGKRDLVITVSNTGKGRKLKPQAAQTDSDSPGFVTGVFVPDQETKFNANAAKAGKDAFVTRTVQPDQGKETTLTNSKNSGLVTRVVEQEKISNAPTAQTGQQNTGILAKLYEAFQGSFFKTKPVKSESQSSAFVTKVYQPGQEKSQSVKAGHQGFVTRVVEPGQEKSFKTQTTTSASGDSEFVTGTFQPDETVTATTSGQKTGQPVAGKGSKTVPKKNNPTQRSSKTYSTDSGFETRIHEPGQEKTVQAQAGKTAGQDVFVTGSFIPDQDSTSGTRYDQGNSSRTQYVQANRPRAQPIRTESEGSGFVTGAFIPDQGAPGNSQFVTQAFQPNQESSAPDGSFRTRTIEPAGKGSKTVPKKNNPAQRSSKTYSTDSGFVTRIQEPGQEKTVQAQAGKTAGQDVFVTGSFIPDQDSTSGTRYDQGNSSRTQYVQANRPRAQPIRTESEGSGFVTGAFIPDQGAPGNSQFVTRAFQSSQERSAPDSSFRTRTIEPDQASSGFGNQTGSGTSFVTRIDQPGPAQSYTVSDPAKSNAPKDAFVTKALDPQPKTLNFFQKMFTAEPEKTEQLVTRIIETTDSRKFPFAIPPYLWKMLTSWNHEALNRKERGPDASHYPINKENEQNEKK